MKKTICTMVLAAVLCSAAGAADAPYTATAKLTPQTAVRIDGVERTFYNAQGREVHPISYAGTTYVPLRSVGELMGKNVNWDSATHTASIGGKRTTGSVMGTPDAAAKEMTVSVSLRPDYTIVIDDVKRTFHDVKGKQVDPMLYNGSIYLPLRAIGEIMGKNVEWDGGTGTVFLSGEVTDFDTNISGGGNMVPGDGGAANNGAKITMQQAREIALQHAGRTAGEVIFVECKLDFDDGRLQYDIEFIHKSGALYTEYDYEIDANTGNILSYDQDAEQYQGTQGQGAQGQGTQGQGTQGQGTQGAATITAERAKQIALAEVPGATMAHIRGFEVDNEHGRVEYEVKIVLNRMEYEFKIDGQTGVILGRDTDYDD